MITDAEQSALDVDWFFTDGHYIGFVASGGGRLPKSVAKSVEDVSILVSYFRQLPQISEAEVNPELHNAMMKRKVNETYLSDFSFMSERGLYSFDKTVLSDFTDESYHLVSIPSTPLRLEDLPFNIAQLVLRSRAPITANSFNLKSIDE